MDARPVALTQALCVGEGLGAEGGGGRCMIMDTGPVALRVGAGRCRVGGGGDACEPSLSWDREDPMQGGRGGAGSEEGSRQAQCVCVCVGGGGIDLT